MKFVRYFDGHIIINLLGVIIRIKHSKPYDCPEVTSLGVTKIKREEKVVVSLTSFPERINTVVKTIKTLLNQSMKPDEVILWLAPEQFPNKEADLPKELLDLRQYGLTIDWYKDIRSYKKIIPALKKFPNAVIITTDDDIYYAEDTVESLYKSYLAHKDEVQAHRCDWVKVEKSKITWEKTRELFKDKHRGQASFHNRLTGYGAVLYPQALIALAYGPPAERAEHRPYHRAVAHGHGRAPRLPPEGLHGRQGALHELRVALAARGRPVEPVALAPGEVARPAALYLLPGAALPGTEGYLPQRVQPLRRQAQLRADYLRRLHGAAQRAGAEPRRALVSQLPRQGEGLLPAARVERRVGRALYPPRGVPVGLPVPHQQQPHMLSLHAGRARPNRTRPGPSPGRRRSPPPSGGSSRTRRARPRTAPGW